MAPLGPWPAPGSTIPLAVAVSGGADSLCLCLLAAAWAAARRLSVLALVVDHGLRASAASEARETGARLHRLGVPARLLRICGLSPGPGLAERARAARYDALTAACRAAGCVDLLLGHHAGDQAETVLMRRRAASGPDGLAGMAGLVETADLRLLRPLLPVEPARLRATLTAAGQGWIEDPSNRDRRAGRTRLRQELAAAPAQGAALLAHQADAARARLARRRAEAAELAASVRFAPQGFAILPPELVSAGALAALIRSVTGQPYRPGSDPVAALVRHPRPATLSGARLLRAGRLGPGWVLLRELAAVAAPVPATPGAIWDRRFALLGDAGPAAGLMIAALGAAPCDGPGPEWARARRRSGLPAAVVATLPALRAADGAVLAVPHLRWCVPGLGLDRLWFAFRPAAPATDAALFTER